MYSYARHMFMPTVLLLSQVKQHTQTNSLLRIQEVETRF